MTRIARGFRRRIRGRVDAARVGEAERAARRLASRGSGGAADRRVFERVGSREVRRSSGLTEKSDLGFLASLSRFEYEVSGRVFLGSDLGLVDRRRVRHRGVAASSVPSNLRRVAQSRPIRDDLSVAWRVARGMGHGKELVGQAKGKVQGGTAHSRDEDFECNGFGGHFSEGSQWEPIVRELGAGSGPGA